MNTRSLCSFTASAYAQIKRHGRAWERVIAWAQARQIREMVSFTHSAEAPNRALGACDSQAHDSAVAEVGLMLRASGGTAAARVGGAWSLCTRLPATLTALEAGQITLAKARIIDDETLDLTDEHTAAVEAQRDQVGAYAGQPGKSTTQDENLQGAQDRATDQPGEAVGRGEGAMTGCSTDTQVNGG
ncbi:MAG: hypothetical protein QOJ06_2567 [Pseudonocardiales bacterium]|jgi:hypothetical protein|nr:hypothetical protein [Pseudonocardiales bacterium]